MPAGMEPALGGLSDLDHHPSFFWPAVCSCRWRASVRHLAMCCPAERRQVFVQRWDSVRRRVPCCPHGGGDGHAVPHNGPPADGRLFCTWLVANLLLAIGMTSTWPLVPLSHVSGPIRESRCASSVPRSRAESVESEHTARGAACVTEDSYLVDPASSHMLVSKIKPCMCKYKLSCTVKLRMAH